MPYERAKDLPTFSAPPVNEVAIGIGFKPLRCWGSVAPGEFRSLIRDRYPKVEDKSPLPPLTAPSEQMLSFGVMEVPPVRRTWFLTETEETLIQVQDDRLHVNWRRVRDEDEYPRYGHVLDEFIFALGQLRTFVEERGERLYATGGEVTYVNHIPEGELWSDWNDLSSVLLDWAPAPQQATGIEAISTAILLNSHAGSNLTSAGRQMSLELKAALRGTDKAKILVLQIVNRGELASDNADVITSWCGQSSEEIVRSFTALTTSKAHDCWRRTR